MSARRATAVVGSMASLALLAAGCGSASQPSSVADRVPRLAALLHRVDADLAAHHYAAARADLWALKAAVARARAAGQLQDSDAARVLDAATQVVSAIPGAATSTAPSAPGATSSGPARPSASATTRTSRPRSIPTAGSVSPSVVPTSSSTASSTSSTAPSPTATTSSATPTTQVSPAAATATPSP